MTQTSRTAPDRRTAVPRRRRFSSSLALLYAAVTVLAVGAWLAVGDRWWTQPVNLTTFWWSLPAVPLLLLAVVARRRTAAVWLAVPAALWVWSYGSAFVPSSGGDRADLRVASFNTYVAAPDPGHVLDLVETHDPDVLLLQEVFPDREAQLVEALADRYPARDVVQTPGVGGVAVFSRFPIVAHHDVGAVTNSRATRVLVLDVGGRAVQVASLHLISPCPRCGTSLSERVEFEGDVRRAEIGEVLAALDPDLPAIVAGDLNSNERAEPYRRLTGAGFRDAQREAGDGLGFTWPNDGRFGPLLRIDWVLARGLEPVDAFVGEGGESDHRPVIADLAFPDD